MRSIRGRTFGITAVFPKVLAQLCLGFFTQQALAEGQELEAESQQIAAEETEAEASEAEETEAETSEAEETEAEASEAAETEVEKTEAEAAPASEEQGEKLAEDHAEEPLPQKEKAPPKKNVVLRYMESIFGEPEHPDRPRFIVYPVVGYAPETSWEFGASGLYVYYAKDDPTNRLSEVSAFGFVTIAGQYGLHMEHALYSHRNEWFVLGEGKVQSFPLKYYGIGPDTPEKAQASVDEFSILIRERLLRKIASSFYIGPELNLDWLTNVKFNFAEGVEPELPNGADGSFNLGAGLGLVFDNRHNVLNVRDGLFSELVFLHSNEVWGSDFSFTTVESDTRYFFPVTNRDTLAMQLFGRFTFGDVPFNELSMLGGDSLLRGYYLGRFRDNHYVGTQLEYRFLPFGIPYPFFRRFGASVFAAAGTVFPGDRPPEFIDFVVAGGAGLRFLLFPEKDIYTRADVALTKEGTAFYLYIGEAF